MQAEEKDRTQLNKKISVRNLVEFIFRSGDIDNRKGRTNQKEAMLEGGRMHRKIQRRMGSEYTAEVPLSFDWEADGYHLLIEGRADGVILDPKDEDGYAVIDEIKGIYRDLSLLEEPVYVHKAQAMAYAYMYAYPRGEEKVGIQMTYVNLDTEEIKRFSEVFEMEWLHEWFVKMVRSYERFTDLAFAWESVRTQSLKNLQFPFAYRPGQKELAQDVYRTILRRKNVFIQAPTGVGKTISTVYPAVKAMGEGLADKIFYLTAKTITRTVAQETFSLLKENGMRLKVLTITAKEKMCICEEMDCNPVACPYAEGHFDRINDAIYDMLSNEEEAGRETILEYAHRHRVCPFEMSLDVATWCDAVICDYNYVFDPNVHLKRFFSEGSNGEYLFLIDEAHNLVERARSMYSASIYKEDFLAVKKIVKSHSEALVRSLKRCNDRMLSYKRQCETYEVLDEIMQLSTDLTRLYTNLDRLLTKQQQFEGRKEVLDFFFRLRSFLNIYEKLDENYEIYTEHTADGRFCLTLFCVDPSVNLQECLDYGRSAVFFSATLLPVDYYKKLLSTREDNYAIYAHTPFDSSRRLLLIGRDVSSKYTRRGASEYEKMARYIDAVVSAKAGNYLIFFPSYQMMQDVFSIYAKIQSEPVRCLLQQSHMTEEEREEFLQQFSENARPVVGFCVLGGIFSEGIDLKKESLIGAVIVGTGLPQIGNERDILKNHYERTMGAGFDYAFRYPGMNKVLQAAGRVIRTMDDVGVVVLLDERFLQSEYRRIFPREWESYRTCTLKEAPGMLADFWREYEKED